MTNNEQDTRKTKRKLKKRKKWLFILIPLAIIITSIAVYVTMLVDKAEDVVTESYQDDGREKSELRDKEVTPENDNVSILFIGVDDSEHRNKSESSLSDALMLATLNKDDHSVKLLSIPRDSYVYIPEISAKDKITHAHAYGGPKATIEAVEGVLDVPVDYYARLNFNAFVDVVDAIDGIEYDVPYEMFEPNSGDVKNAIHLLPGEQTLDGEHALALARSRKYDNDLERGKRQQEIIKTIMDEILSANSVLKYNDIMDAVGDNMATNMSFDQMKSFISYGTSGSLDIETLNLKGSDLWADKYYYELDEQDLADKKEELKDHLDLNSSNSMTTNKSSTTNTASPAN